MPLFFFLRPTHNASFFQTHPPSATVVIMDNQLAADTASTPAEDVPATTPTATDASTDDAASTTTPAANADADATNSSESTLPDLTCEETMEDADPEPAVPSVEETHEPLKRGKKAAPVVARKRATPKAKSNGVEPSAGITKPVQQDPDPALTKGIHEWKEELKVYLRYALAEERKKAKEAEKRERAKAARAAKKAAEVEEAQPVLEREDPQTGAQPQPSHIGSLIPPAFRNKLLPRRVYYEA